MLNSLKKGVISLAKKINANPKTTKPKGKNRKKKIANPFPKGGRVI